VVVNDVTAGWAGLDRNTAAALSYLLGAVSGLVVLATAPDDYVRFHARQSAAASGALFGLYLLAGIAAALLGGVPVVGPAFAAVEAALPVAFGLAWGGLWLVLSRAAYRGRRLALPVVGPLVAR